MSLRWKLSDYYDPNPKQAVAHKVPADECLFGGAKGGGKTWLIVWETFKHGMEFGDDALILVCRRHLDDLEESVIRQSKLYWPDDAYSYHETKHNMKLASGAKVLYRSLQNPQEDTEKHFGREYTLVCVDESTRTLPEEDHYQNLLGSLRSPHNAEMLPRIILCTNPRGPGHRWHKRRFVDPVPEGMKTFTVEDHTRIFIPSKVWDNPYLNPNSPKCNDARYVSKLRQQPEHLRRAYLEGSWEVWEGMAFPQWEPEIHICEPFPIPQSWKITVGLDWGFKNDPFYICWLAKSPDTNRIFLIDEWYGRRVGPSGGTHGVEMPVKEVAQGFLDRCDEKNIPAYSSIEADPSMWRKDSEAASIADLWMRHHVRRMRKADNDREYRYQVFNELLAIDPDLGKPRFQVFSGCDGFIETLPLLETDEEEDKVKKCSDDHPYDGTGYGLVALADAQATTDDRLAVEKALRRRMQENGIPLPEENDTFDRNIPI